MPNCSPPNRRRTEGPCCARWQTCNAQADRAAETIPQLSDSPYTESLCCPRSSPSELVGAADSVKPCELRSPYTFSSFESEARYTLPLTTVGGLYFDHSPGSSLASLMVESQSSVARLLASNARRTPSVVPWSPSATPVAAADNASAPPLPFAETVSVPVGFTRRVQNRTFGNWSRVKT